MADQNNINEFCIHGKITGWTSYFRSAKFSSTPIITLDNAGIDVLSKLVRAKPQLWVAYPLKCNAISCGLILSGCYHIHPYQAEHSWTAENFQRSD